MKYLIIIFIFFSGCAWKSDLIRAEQNYHHVQAELNDTQYTLTEARKSAAIIENNLASYKRQLISCENSLEEIKKKSKRICNEDESMCLGE